MLRILEPTLGVALMLVVLIDVFLTVLYARMGTGILSAYLARAVWKAYRAGSKAFGRHRATVLSLCGPSILVTLVGLWALLLTLGAALIMHQHLGAGVRAQAGPTGRDFITAMYAAGSSLSIVSISDYAPAAGPFRLMF